ncbi:sigma factor [Umezawaea sp. NPDC059074]|uniref:sigma factor n=1 Tax=Umezawaea sp. NPDC059074 TaxID=3346716 RepID=UPI0036AA0B54
MWTGKAHPAHAAGSAARAPSIDDLLKRVALGDRRAFDALYQAGATKVHSVIRHVVDDGAVAEEVAFDVWLQVWRSAPNQEAARGGAMGWLLITAHRNAIARLRSSPVPELPGAAAALAALRASPRAATPAEDQWRAVSMAYGGRTREEIGAVLGVERGTVPRLLRDGVKQARGSFDTMT